MLFPSASFSLFSTATFSLWWHLGWLCSRGEEAQKMGAQTEDIRDLKFWTADLEEGPQWFSGFYSGSWTSPGNRPHLQHLLLLAGVDRQSPRTNSDLNLFLDRSSKNTEVLVRDASMLFPRPLLAITVIYLITFSHYEMLWEILLCWFCNHILNFIRLYSNSSLNSKGVLYVLSVRMTQWAYCTCTSSVYGSKVNCNVHTKQASQHHDPYIDRKI